MKLNQFTQNNNEELLSTINVTSLVDVTLVILIAFILIAPIMEQGISLNLPKATSAKIKSKEALTIEVDKKGQTYLDSFPVSITIFTSRIKNIASFNKEQAILIRADQNNKYGDIVKIIDLINSAGLTKLGILTQEKK